MASTCKMAFAKQEVLKMSGNEEQKDDVYINQLDDEFDFVDAFDDADSSTSDDLLPVS